MRHSHGVTAKKCTKKRDAHAKLLFCLSNLLVFGHCHRRRHRCLHCLSSSLSKIKGPLLAGWCIKIFLSWFFRDDQARIKLPRNMTDAKGLGEALSNYTDEYFTQVLVGFVVIYILYPFDCNALTVMFTLS